MTELVAEMISKLTNVINDREIQELLVTNYSVLTKGGIKDFINKAKVGSGMFSIALSGLRERLESLAAEEKMELFTSHPEADVTATFKRGLDLLEIINKKIVDATTFYAVKFRRSKKSPSVDEQVESEEDEHSDVGSGMSSANDTFVDLDRTVIGHGQSRSKGLSDMKSEKAGDIGQELSELMKKTPELMKAIALPRNMEEEHFDFAEALPSSTINGHHVTPTSALQSSSARPFEDINSPAFLGAFIQSITSMNVQNAENMQFMRDVAKGAMSNATTKGFNARQGARLKELVMPMFSGENPEDFGSWWNMFSNLIGSNESLTPAAKLAYMKTYVTKEAKDVIDALPLEDDCYDIACNTLHERFGFEIIRNNLPLAKLKELVAANIPNEGKALLKCYHQQFASYQTIVKRDYFNAPYMELVKAAYPLAIRAKMEAKEIKCIQRHRRKMTPQEFMDALKCIVEVHAAITKVEEAQYVNFAREEQPRDVIYSNRGFQKRPRTHYVKGGKPYTRDCLLCYGHGHPEFFCTKYPLKEDRMSIVSERNLCKCCYRKEHPVGTECQKSCSKCNSQEHGLAICPLWVDFPERGQRASKR